MSSKVENNFCAFLRTTQLKAGVWGMFHLWEMLIRDNYTQTWPAGCTSRKQPEPSALVGGVWGALEPGPQAASSKDSPRATAFGGSGGREQGADSRGRRGSVSAHPTRCPPPNNLPTCCQATTELNHVPGKPKSSIKCEKTWNTVVNMDKSVSCQEFGVPRSPVSQLCECGVAAPFNWGPSRARPGPLSHLVTLMRTA